MESTAASPTRAPELGDMDAEEFRRFGYEVIDRISAQLAEPGRWAVFPQTRPGDTCFQVRLPIRGFTPPPVVAADDASVDAEALAASGD